MNAKLFRGILFAFLFGFMMAPLINGCIRFFDDTPTEETPLVQEETDWICKLWGIGCFND